MALSRIVRGVAVLVCVFAGGYGYGALSYQHGIFPYPQIKALKRVLVRTYFPQPLGYHDTSDRERIDCRQFAKDTTVIFTFGQSNSANHGATRHFPGPRVFNFNMFDGKCYAARDPLLGATESGGSVWSRLGDLLIDSGRHARVLIAPVGVGGTAIKHWAPGGVLHGRVTRTLSALKDHGLTVTHLLWHQGEQDVFDATSRDDYIERFGRLLGAIRALGIDAPLYAAIASICHNAGSGEIRDAQRALPMMFAGVRPGPNTDTLDSYSDRFDGCHFTDLGMDRHARLWFQALR